MLKHLFKLIWNKKKQNFLLMTEIFFSFLIMFAVFTLAVYNYQNYRRPMGFTYDDVWALSYYSKDRSDMSEDSLNLFYETLKQAIGNAPEVAAVSYVSNNSPFSMSENSSTISSGKQNVMTDHYSGDDDYPRVLQPVLLSGRWFGREDDGAKLAPVVINQALKEEFFPGEDAIGKVMKVGDREVRITGVVQNMKDKGDYKSVRPAIYQRTGKGSYAWLSRMLIKVKPGADAGFESRLYKQVAGIMQDANVEIEHLTEKRVVKNSITLIPLIIFGVIAGFLIINVSLGLFGVLWYTISKRKAEIGLRRAMGATGGAITRQVVSETMVLTSISVVTGLIFAVQFPLLNVFFMPKGVYIIAIVLAALFIYALAVLCALYPGRQAANIYPAVALHED
ncbi:FtsX-like permease family protein [Chitinophaga lutea]|uniref:FtsX-like permease family protein n=1 Tax=Chitinophaga lutea TaxID=2488634 RepID=A0A3N4PM70_9BACT|nr:ABC transporter permease [Chitinophaga lutea]RPE05991.1 FtsX-like permease family protein [Chitinophaga lutea]